ncbi:MAG TPA: prepilin-type N-terminal cleavage/methylation domain-containing protein [Actinomycetota bacterium]|nr:prepilin-type N-terminal cleavage/methylation domain-containing protein [Actinomycetota bacterium]
MFQRIREAREKEEGFTLIELLVVILIIAILAAIAIPVFLSQREKGWKSQSESAVKNAATAMESYATGNNGDYSGTTLTNLTAEGYSPVQGVTLAIVSANTSDFCLSATHTQSTVPVMYWDSAVGAPQETACT